MGSASLQFITYGLLIAGLSNLNSSVAWRQIVLLAASLGFLLFFSRDPLAFLPIAAFLGFGFIGANVRGGGRWQLGAFLLAGILTFIWLKKYAFIPSNLFLNFPYLTLGLSYIFFRVLHLIIDASNSDLPGRISLISYLNYTLNFTTFISGPIQTYQGFAESQLLYPPLPLNAAIIGRSLARVIIGFFKVNVVSLALSMVQSNAISSLGEVSGSHKLATGAVIAAVYPLYLYANFSGYIDIVIALARLMRIELPENFDRPFSSKNFLIFWSRWHITLSNWLKTYVYNPLVIACMQRWPSSAAEPYIVAFTFFVTFFLIGIWHGQTSEFAFYGVLLGLGVSLNKLYQMLLTKRLGRTQFNAMARGRAYGVLTRGLTYTWYAFSIMWFWSSWVQLRGLAGQLSAREMVGVWVGIWIVFSVVLELWEITRDWLLSFQFEGRPFLVSRYAQTAWCTALVLVAITTILILNAPAPDIVYKAF